MEKLKTLVGKLKHTDEHKNLLIFLRMELATRRTMCYAYLIENQEEAKAYLEQSAIISSKDIADSILEKVQSPRIAYALLFEAFMVAFLDDNEIVSSLDEGEQRNHYIVKRNEYMRAMYNMIVVHFSSQVSDGVKVTITNMERLIFEELCRPPDVSSSAVDDDWLPKETTKTSKKKKRTKGGRSRAAAGGGGGRSSTRGIDDTAALVVTKETDGEEAHV